MKLAHLRSHVIRTLLLLPCVFFFVGAQNAALLLANQASPGAQSSKPHPAVLSKSQRVANPLNDLLDEAQRDIDKSNFESAIAPLQKVIADQPEFAYAHFQLAYVYTALKRTDEARAEYARTIAIDPKMSEAYLNLPRFIAEVGEPFGVSRSVQLLGCSLLERESTPDAWKDLLDEFELNQTLAPRWRQAIMPVLRKPSKPSSIWILTTLRPSITWAGWPFVTESPPKQKQDSGAQWRFSQRSLRGARGWQKASTPKRSPKPLPPTANISNSCPMILKHAQGSSIFSSNKTRVTRPLRNSIVWTPARPPPSNRSSSAQLHGGLGRIFLQKRDFAAAEKELRIALRLDGKNLAYWKDLSSTFFLSGNCPAALSTLDEIAKMEQPGAGVWFVRAICYDKLNQPKLALEAYQMFLALDQDKNPDQVWQARERSKVLQRMLERKR